MIKLDSNLYISLCKSLFKNTDLWYYCFSGFSMLGTCRLSEHTLEYIVYPVLRQVETISFEVFL